MTAYLRSIGIERKARTGEEYCPECNGRGYFYSDNGPAPREIDCDWCGGDGVIEAEQDEEDDGPVVLNLARQLDAIAARRAAIEAGAEG